MRYIPWLDDSTINICIQELTKKINKKINKIKYKPTDASPSFLSLAVIIPVVLACLFWNWSLGKLQSALCIHGVQLCFSFILFIHQSLFDIACFQSARYFWTLSVAAWAGVVAWSYSHSSPFTLIFFFFYVNEIFEEKKKKEGTSVIMGTHTRGYWHRVDTMASI